MKNFNLKNKKGGSAVIELVFYLSILAILVLVVINAMIMMTKSFRETTIHASLGSGASIMERMSRQIKQASSITSLTATDLVLAAKDLNGADISARFVLSGSNIAFSENGSSLGNLNSANLTVSSLSFTQINTSKGTAVKIFFTVGSTSDPLNRTVDFYNTVVLRGDY